MCIYVYLLCLAGRRVNYALVNVESKLDVARTIGGALMCLTVPLATYQVITVPAFNIGIPGIRFTIRFSPEVKAYTAKIRMSVERCQWHLSNDAAIGHKHRRSGENRGFKIISWGPISRGVVIVLSAMVQSWMEFLGFA